MKALRIFFTAFFTQHIGTKFLSLLLSVTIFLLVQQSQTAIVDVPELAIEFNLADDMRAYVLTRDVVRLEDLRLKGLQSIVKNKERELLAANNVVRLTINQRLYNNYHQDRRIAVTARLLREKALFGPEIEVLGLAENATREAVIDTLSQKEFALELAPGQEKKIQLAAGLPWVAAGPDARRLEVTFRPAAVVLRGPSTSTQQVNVDRLLVEIADLSEFLRTYESPQEEVTFQESSVVIGINLRESGLADRHRPLFEVRSRQWSGSFADFEQRIEAVFRVKQETVDTEIAVAVLVRLGKDIDDVREYRPQSGLVTESDFVGGRIAALPVSVPKSLAGSDLLTKVALVLDFSRAEKLLEGVLEVPIFLDAVEQNMSDEDEARIRRIAIRTTARSVKFERKN